MKEVEPGKIYLHRGERVSYAFDSRTEFIHRGQFVKIRAFNNVDETASIATRLEEYSVVPMDELKPKPTVFYNDIPVAESHTPIEDDGKPNIGDIIEGKKVLRAKPINISSIVGYSHALDTLDDSILLAKHPIRQFVFWCVEVEG